MANRAFFKGHATFVSALKKIGGNFYQDRDRALYKVTQFKATECKKRTPVWGEDAGGTYRTPPGWHQPGTLRSTVRAHEPTHEGTRIYCLITAGGPVAPYAVYVHENLSAHHDTGQAKFIESVVNESRGTVGAEVAKLMQLRKD